MTLLPAARTSTVQTSTVQYYLAADLKTRLIVNAADPTRAVLAGVMHGRCVNNFVEDATRELGCEGEWSKDEHARYYGSYPCAFREVYAFDEPLPEGAYAIWMDFSTREHTWAEVAVKKI